MLQQLSRVLPTAGPQMMRPAAGALSSRIATFAFGTRVKPMRDPARPAPPMTPYFMYLQEYRKSAPSTIKAKDMTKIAAERWRTLPETEKTPFLQAYESKKTLYDAAFREYKESGKLDAWKRDPLKPKKPLTGFMRYSMQWRKDHGSGLKVTEITKKAAVAWKALPADQKAVFDSAYRTEKAQYDSAMKAYKDSGKEQAFKEKTGRAAAEKKMAEKKMKMAMKSTQMKTRMQMRKKRMQMRTKAEKMKMKMAEMKKKKQMKTMKMRERAKMQMKKMKVAKAQKELRALNSQAKKLGKLVRRANTVSMKMKKMK